MDSPQLLVSLQGKVEDKAARFVAVENALALLESLPANGSLAVISVVGLYRTLAGHTNGFDIGATVQPQTEGIWMWVLDPQTLKLRGIVLPEAAYLDNMTVVLLDTEGLGSFTKNETHDVKIFSLAVLLCSYLIYNSLGTIDDTAVDSISLVVELAKAIKSSKTTDSDTEVDIYTLRTYFPKFMWLLRDFSLDLVQNGKTVTPDQYLETALQPLPGHGPEIDGKNKVRECLRTFFDNRTCRTLKRPVEDEEQLQSLGQLKPSDFRPQYLEEAHELVRYVYKHVTPKTIFNTAINGKIFAQLVRSYVESINTGSVPTIETTWMHVVRQQTAEAVEQAVKQYHTSKFIKCIRILAVRLPLSYEELQEVHNRAELDVLVELLGKLKRAATTGTELCEMVVKVHGDLTKQLRKVNIDNIQKSLDTNNAIANNLFSSLAAQVASGEVITFEAISNTFRNITTRYISEAVPPCNVDVWAQYAPKLLAFAESLSHGEVQKAQGMAIKEFDLERSKARHEYSVLQELYESVDIERRREEDNVRTLRSENADMRYEITAKQKMVKSLESDLANLIEQCALNKVAEQDALQQVDKVTMMLAQAQVDLVSMREHQTETEYAEAEAIRKAAETERRLVEAQQDRDEQVQRVKTDEAMKKGQEEAALKKQFQSKETAFKEELETKESALKKELQAKETALAEQLQVKDTELSERNQTITTQKEEIATLKATLEKTKQEYEQMTKKGCCSVM